MSPVRRAALALLLPLAVVLAACTAPSDDDPAATEDADGGETTADGGETLVVDTSFDLQTADPGRLYEPTGQIIGKALYDTLLTFEGDDATEPVPLLAESFEMSEDGTSLTLELRDDAVFSDGSPVTAEDVVFSLERVRDLEGNPSFLMDGITVTQEGDSTIVLESEAPNPSLPYLLPTPALGVVNSEVVTANGGSADPDDDAEGFLNGESAGSGPYVLESYSTTTEVVLVANENYWGEPPAYDRVVIRNVEAPAQLLNVEAGDSDIALDLTGDQAATVEGDLQVHEDASPYMVFLFGNQNPEISDVTSNPGFVEAVRLGVDYEGLLELAGEGSVQAPGVIPSMLLGALPSDAAAERDVDGARAALAASGLENPTVELEYPSDLTVKGLSFQPLAERVQANLEEVGITVELAPAPVATALENYRAGTEELGLWYWGPDYPDPASYLAFLPGELVGLRAGWEAGSDAEAEDLGAAAASELDNDVRATQYQDIQTRLNEVGPFVPLLQPGEYAVAAPTVSDLVLHPTWTLDVAGLGVQ